MTTMLVLVIVTALLFDYVNGWNDSANAIATVVSTRVLSPFQAVIFAAVLNFLGALVSVKVAKTIAGDIVDPSVMTLEAAFAAMLAATLWVAICTFWGLPISGSHSLIGGLIGAIIVRADMSALKFDGITKVLIGMFASPLLGFVVGYLMLVATYWVASVMTRERVRKTFNVLQIASSGFMAFSHGQNDAQKVMGVITLALFTSGTQLSPTQEFEVPLWVIVTCGTVMGLGTAAGGWRVIKTLGMKLAHIRPVEGFAAETGAGAVLQVAAGLGVPVSTTHTITGSILGVGAAYQAKSVKWSIGKKIIMAWIFTLPTSALLAAALSFVMHAIFE